MGDGSKLYRREAKAGAKWHLVKDFEPFGYGELSRLAFDPSGKWLVLVAERPNQEDPARESGEG